MQLQAQEGAQEGGNERNNALPSTKVGRGFGIRVPCRLVITTNILGQRGLLQRPENAYTPSRCMFLTKIPGLKLR
jgi:hypothetical protein